MSHKSRKKFSNQFKAQSLGIYCVPAPAGLRAGDHRRGSVLRFVGEADSLTGD